MRCHQGRAVGRCAGQRGAKCCTLVSDRMQVRVYLHTMLRVRSRTRLTANGCVEAIHHKQVFCEKCNAGIHAWRDEA